MLMINTAYLYLLSSFALIAFLYFIFNYRHEKSDINNKIMLKNLLEGLELDLPDELKGLDNSPTDPNKLS